MHLRFFNVTFRFLFKRDMDWLSIPLIYRVVKLSNFLRTPFGNVINVLENCFAQPIMKVIGKRKPFKTNNSSEILYGLHISNALTMGGERCNRRNSCHSQLC